MVDPSPLSWFIQCFLFLFFYSVHISNTRFFSYFKWIGMIVLLMRPNTKGIKADTRIWLPYNTEASCCLILSTALTQHKDHPQSVLLLSVHVIHNVSLRKLIKGCCQDKHQEIALLIDNSFPSLECSSLLLTTVISRTSTCGKPHIQSHQSMSCSLSRCS